MALHIDIMNPETCQAESIVWHVGVRIPETKHYGPKTCVEVYADGDELAWVLRNFQNIPSRQGARTMRWDGDFAKFILNNI